MNNDETQRTPVAGSDAPTVAVPEVNKSEVDESDTQQVEPDTEPVARTSPLLPTVPELRIRRPRQTIAVPPPKRTVLDSGRLIARIVDRLGSRPPRATRPATIALLVVLVAILGALIALIVEPTWFAGLRNRSNLPSTAVHRPTTSSSIRRSSGGAPLISAMRPDFGVAGQTVSIVGSGIVSASGLIVAVFGSTVAPTRCPNEQHCLVVIPPMKGRTKSVAVRLRTAAGFSNTLEFHYE